MDEDRRKLTKHVHGVSKNSLSSSKSMLIGDSSGTNLSIETLLKKSHSPRCNSSPSTSVEELSKPKFGRTTKMRKKQYVACLESHYKNLFSRYDQVVQDNKKCKKLVTGLILDIFYLKRLLANRNEYAQLIYNLSNSGLPLHCSLEEVLFTQNLMVQQNYNVNEMQAQIEAHFGARDVMTRSDPMMNQNELGIPENDDSSIDENDFQLEDYDLYNSQFSPSAFIEGIENEFKIEQGNIE